MLTMRLPTALGFVFPPPQELPAEDPRLAWMLRQLGQPRVGEVPPGAALVRAIVDDAERDALMCSLATALVRAHYAVRRFRRTVELLASRREASGPLIFDTAAKASTFDASSALAATRSMIDEILWVAARRAGMTAEQAGEWRPETLLRCDLARPDHAQFDVPEVAALRRRTAWYERLNKYRNTLTHHGWRLIIGGYFPIDDTSAEALDENMNVMIVPDLASLGRAKRPHEWTYVQKTRVESVVEDAWAGLLDLVEEIGTEWGAIVPAEGSMPPERRPHVMILAPCPAVTLQDDELLVAVFSSRERARTFQLRMCPGDDTVDVFELAPSSLPYDGDETPRYWISVPAGPELAQVVDSGVVVRGIVLGLDPNLDPLEARVVSWTPLRRFDVAAFAATDDPMAHVAVPATTMRGRLYVVRRRPTRGELADAIARSSKEAGSPRGLAHPLAHVRKRLVDALAGPSIAGASDAYVLRLAALTNIAVLESGRADLSNLPRIEAHLVDLLASLGWSDLLSF